MPKKFRILAIIMFSMFFGNCKKKSVHLENKCLEKESHKYSLVTDLMNITISDSMPTIYKHIQIVDDTLLFGTINRKYEIDIYNIKKKSFIKTIKLDKNFIPNFASFYVSSLDSIFITQEPHTITLINSNGLILNKWLLSEAPINWKLSDESTPLYYFDSDTQNITYFDEKEANLHLTLTHTDIFYFNNRNEFKLHYVYNIKSKKWVISFGEIEEAYSSYSKQTKAYLPFQAQPFSVVKGDSSIVGYPISHYISIYNNKTGKIISRKCISSKFIEKLFDAYNYDADSQVQMDFINTSPYYGSISYHKNIGIFSRIAVHEQNLKLSNGKLSKLNKKTISVILFNNKLEKIDEFILDKNSEYSSFGDPASLLKAYPTNDGFLGTFKEESIKNEASFRNDVQFKFTKK